MRRLKLTACSRSLPAASGTRGDKTPAASAPNSARKRFRQADVSTIRRSLPLFNPEVYPRLRCGTELTPPRAKCRLASNRRDEVVYDPAYSFCHNEQSLRRALRGPGARATTTFQVNGGSLMHHSVA